MSSPAPGSGQRSTWDDNPDGYPGSSEPDRDEDEDMDYEPESERSEDIEYFDDAESHEGDEAIRQGLFGTQMPGKRILNCSLNQADN